MAVVEGQLLERTRELAAVNDSLGAARVGLGSLTLVEGPPGIGKTELLAAASACARQSQMLVLSARGGELEQSLPYAVVRQLFEPALTRADRARHDRLLSGAAVHAEGVVDPRAGAGTAAVASAAVMHGLYWLTANLAQEQPMLLIVDDLQWSDFASANWLVYLAQRLEGLAVAVIIGAGPAEPSGNDGVLQALLPIDGLRRLQLAPLSVAAIEGLTRAAVGEQMQQTFAEACHAATGGIPFYAVELLRALCHDRVVGVAADVEAVNGLTPRAVVDATLARLDRLPSQARRVAEAVAVLEPNAELRWVAELAGLEVDAAAVAADMLMELGMLRSVAPCRVAHPILRSAVQGEISPARRGVLHLKVARAFARAGMPVDAIAAHLMQTPQLGDAWIVSTLRDAARQARARGAPDGAVTYLQRALAERPAAPERRELLLELGGAESQIRSPQAADHLREALALAEHPDEVATAALGLGQTLFAAGAIDEAFDIFSATVERTDGHSGRAVLELQAYMLAMAGPAGRMAETTERAAALEALAPDGCSAAGAVQACLALREMVAGAPRDRIAQRAERALAGRGYDRSSNSSSSALGRDAPGMAFLWIDDLDRAEELFTHAIKDASRMGTMRSFENYSALRGYALRRRGDLANAAADIEPILANAARGETPRAATLLALITQVMLFVDHGRPEAAEALARFAPIPAVYESLPFVALLRHAQAAAQRAQRNFCEAAATLTAVGAVCDANGIHSPAVVPWRSELGLALAGTDRHDEGVELASDELRLAEHCDVDRARGVALRALGLLEGGQPGLGRLEAAVRAFERSPARLELGWASYELGAALRRASRRRDARAPLDRALDLALACGAELLAQHCREELEALGTRPRSAMLTGAASLTASERRVCRLAAEGLRNTDIAQALFVSLRTVETHLGNAYRKLDITSRAELPPALATTMRELT
jgi:DNA-binding CsgD family transcriptional regulator